MRLIDGDKLYETLYEIRMDEVAKYGRNNTKHCCSLSTALYEIHNAPTIDAVEVVRCKDCKHRRNSKQGWYCGYEYDRSDPYEMTRRADDENYYCADAERKENE